MIWDLLLMLNSPSDYAITVIDGEVHIAAIADLQDTGASIRG